MLNLTSRKRGPEEDLEDGELRDIDPCDVGSISSLSYRLPLEEHNPYHDGYDDNLLGDAADRARLDSLSELERESELYERSVRREEMFYKWGIKCFLLSKDKDGDAEVSASNSAPLKERSSMRRLNLEAQRAADKRRSAFERLMEQRSIKKMRDDDPERLCEQLQDEDVVEQRLAEHKLEQLKQLACADTAKKLKLKARDIYSDESSASTDDEDDMDMSSSSNEPETFISSLKEVQKVLLTRYHLERFLDIPIFDQTVIGCFVRISLCGIPSNHPAIYRLTRIVGVERNDQEYLVGNRRTRVKLQLKHGAHERSFRLDAISNQPVLEPEFLYWMKACQRDSEPLPSIKSINKKEKDIDKARNFCFTEGDVELMVQTKQRAGQKPVSAAYRKVCLIMERDMAVDSNDMKKAHELQKQIKLIDEQSLSEHQREKRVQYMSPTTTAPTRIPNPPEPSTKTKPKKFDWQQYMRRRYKKFAHLSSEQVQQLQKPIENTTNAVSSDATPPAQSTELEEVNSSEEQNIEKIDLYELHNFEVNLDVSKLMQFSEICHEIDGLALETVAQ